MNRKNTILLAVLVNACLLIVLFVTAVTTQEEVAIAPTHELSVTPSRQDPSPPLFSGEELDIRPQELPQVVVPETPIVHALPPVEAPPLLVEKPVVATSVEVTVKKGDTLEKIAKEHHTTVDEIMKINHLPSSFLRVGQRLSLPVEKAKPAPKVAEKSVQEGPDYYTIKVGDNPWTIAMKHHLKVEELLKLNDLNQEKARKLKPGDRLRIR